MRFYAEFHGRTSRGVIIPLFREPYYFGTENSSHPQADPRPQWSPDWPAEPAAPTRRSNRPEPPRAAQFRQKGIASVYASRALPASARLPLRPMKHEKEHHYG